MALNPQVFNLVIILVMMQVSKKIPFDNPSVLLGTSEPSNTSSPLLWDRVKSRGPSSPPSRTTTSSNSALSSRAS
ncbi:inorganic phosphate transporter [Histoplasma capsulatum H143]|uniref:Inorganic phosphate transporter n=1 Tax=Ajellomyces capsulatus (strain H143) TaxID=544712 RepID=C6H3D1_AJECH|nr:inorganic phosphate transporter [Histoplasma capsulatum H143]